MIDPPAVLAVDSPLGDGCYAAQTAAITNYDGRLPAAELDSYVSGVDPFNTITTYRLTYPQCCGLGNPEMANDLLVASPRVDSLSHYTIEMWDVLTDVVLLEWFGLRLPPSKVPWGGPVYLPDSYRLLFCWDRRYAHQAQAEINRRYLSLNRESGCMSIFEGYGLKTADDLERERDGLLYLARQADHFRSTDEYLFVVQDVYASGTLKNHT